jgi:outer membrane protein OmpA-like peptidoglycan-associated protein
MTARTARGLFAAAVLGAVASGCNLHNIQPSSDPHSSIVVGARPSSALVVVSDPTESSLQEVVVFVTATARPGEKVIVLDSQGVVLASSSTPGALAMVPPVKPVLPPDPTTFQRGEFHNKMIAYLESLTDDRRSLEAALHCHFITWATSFERELLRAGQSQVGQLVSNPSPGVALDQAEAIFSSLNQAGLELGTRQVVVDFAVVSGSAPSVTAQLQETTIVVVDFPGGVSEQANWQADLDQAGAIRTVLLVPGLEDQLVSVVDGALDGAIVRDLSARILFDLGQANLRPAAKAILQRVLVVLTKDPHATADINGYTDAIGTPQVNLALSLARAEAVRAWLVSHGINPDRVSAVGYGDADPVVPEGPMGQQPLDRRVEVVIDLVG